MQILPTLYSKSAKSAIRTQRPVLLRVGGSYGAAITVAAAITTILLAHAELHGRGGLLSMRALQHRIQRGDAGA
jgi:hypothetical protein